MAKSEFIVGPDFNIEALAEYKDLLTTAYTNGESNGGSMDWNDVQAALEKGIEGLGGEARQFMEAAQTFAFDDDNDDEFKISFAESSNPTNEAQSAAKLLFSYRYPHWVKWEDVDAAYEALSIDQNTAPSL